MCRGPSDQLLQSSEEDMPNNVGMGCATLLSKALDFVSSDFKTTGTTC
jgi:hypothetical protein